MTDTGIVFQERMTDGSWVNISIHDYVALVTHTPSTVRIVPTNPAEGNRTDIDRLTALRSILGYVEDASDTVITISVDDATKSIVVRVGRTNGRSYTGDSIRSALDRAIEGEITECQ